MGNKEGANRESVNFFLYTSNLNIIMVFIFPFIIRKQGILF